MTSLKLLCAAAGGIGIRRCILTVAALFLTVSTGWCATNYNTFLLSNPGGESSGNPWVTPGWNLIADGGLVANSNWGTPRTCGARMSVRAESSPKLYHASGTTSDSLMLTYFL